MSVDVELLRAELNQIQAMLGCRYASVFTQETTTSQSATDLATVGPEITGLPRGTYVLLYGCTFSVDNGETAAASYSVNGAAPLGPTQISGFGVQTSGTASIQSSKAQVETLTGASNSIRMKYQSQTGASVAFTDRWLIALKVAVS